MVWSSDLQIDIPVLKKNTISTTILMGYSVIIKLFEFSFKTRFVFYWYKF